MPGEGYGPLLFSISQPGESSQAVHFPVSSEFITLAKKDEEQVLAGHLQFGESVFATSFPSMEEFNKVYFYARGLGSEATTFHKSWLHSDPPQKSTNKDREAEGIQKRDARLDGNLATSALLQNIELFVAWYLKKVNNYRADDAEYLFLLEMVTGAIEILQFCISHAIHMALCITSSKLCIKLAMFEGRHWKCKRIYQVHQTGAGSKLTKSGCHFGLNYLKQQRHVKN